MTHPPFSTHPQPHLTAHHLVKTFGTTQALNDVSLTINTGESVAIMGPSGSGKTTLLHALSGIIQPDTGTVELNGNPPLMLSALTTAQRTTFRAQHCGFVFQQGLLIPELTVEENVALAAMVAGVPRKEALYRARNLLESLGLADKFTQRIGALSGGQQQRVGIARSQVTGAPLTFADEPTGALDSRTAQEVMSTLLNLVPGQGKTLVIVTHDGAVAQRCSRIITLVDGTIAHDTAHSANNFSR